MAPQGMSVHVGVNNPDPKFGVTPLQGSVPDAISMQNIATIAGFNAQPFHDGEATFDKVTAAVLNAAAKLQAGDIFLFTFAGHGSFQPTSALIDGGRDETILLRDCLLIDNFVRRNLWSQFKKGVRILAIADSCHSETALLSLNAASAAASALAATLDVVPDVPAVDLAGGGSPQSESIGETDLVQPPPRQAAKRKGVNRGLTEADRERILDADKEIHERITKQLLSGEAAKLKASLMTLAACLDRQEALDFPDHGAFTRALLEVWNGGQFLGDYNRFIEDIQAKFSPLEQFPNMQLDQADDAFVKQKPFTI